MLHPLAGYVKLETEWRFHSHNHECYRIIRCVFNKAVRSIINAIVGHHPKKLRHGIRGEEYYAQDDEAADDW